MINIIESTLLACIDLQSFEIFDFDTISFMKLLQDQQSAVIYYTLHWNICSQIKLLVQCYTRNYFHYCIVSLYLFTLRKLWSNIHFIQISTEIFMSLSPITHFLYRLAYATFNFLFRIQKQSSSITIVIYTFNLHYQTLLWNVCWWYTYIHLIWCKQSTLDAYIRICRWLYNLL